jgi:rubredoxin
MAPNLRKYRCTVCEHIYDPEEGDPLAGIPPGTPFEDIVESWVCPECGAMKADFEPMDD